MGTKNQLTKKSTDNKPKKNQGDSTPGIVVGTLEKNPFGSIPGLRKLSLRSNLPLKILVGVAVLVLLGLFARFAYNAANTPSDLPTPTEAARVEHDNVLNNPPAANASPSEKAIYYGKLVGLQAEARDYQGAIDAFKKWEAADASGIKYNNYISLAMYYHNVNDNKSALEALDKAASLVPPTPDEEKGYFPDLVKQRIDKLRKEYS
jgi:tetratricopeptide (TPR) repeat protein